MDILNATKKMMVSFAREEDGAQVVEYALVIALVSIALALALSRAFSTTTFTAFVTRVGTCLAGGTGTPPSC